MTPCLCGCESSTRPPARSIRPEAGEPSRYCQHPELGELRGIELPEAFANAQEVRTRRVRSIAQAGHSSAYKLEHDWIPRRHTRFCKFDHVGGEMLNVGIGRPHETPFLVHCRCRFHWDSLTPCPHSKCGSPFSSNRRSRGSDAGSTAIRHASTANVNVEAHYRSDPSDARMRAVRQEPFGRIRYPL